MKVLVLGASGKTGAAVVHQALTAGHAVTAFVHSVDGYEPPDGVAVKEGDSTNPDAIDSAVAGQDAVIDTIGSKTPYHRDISLEADTAEALIASMKRHGVSRLLVTSMVGEGDSISNATVLERLLLKTFLRGARKDKANMEANVQASELRWTIARPAILNDDDPIGDIRVFEADTGAKAHKITRKDLAAWLVAQLDSDQFVGQAATIANR